MASGGWGRSMEGKRGGRRGGRVHRGWGLGGVGEEDGMESGGRTELRLGREGQRYGRRGKWGGRGRERDGKEVGLVRRVG